MSVYEIKKPKRINSVSVSVTLALLAFGYLGYFFIPAWWPIFQETGIMRGICNDAYNEFDNDKLLAKLVSQSARTRLGLKRENFKLVRVPYLPSELSSNSSQYFTLRGKECRLTLDYVQKVEWPFTGKYTNIHWNRTITADLHVIQWGN